MKRILLSTLVLGLSIAQPAQAEPLRLTTPGIASIGNHFGFIDAVMLGGVTMWGGMLDSSTDMTTQRPRDWVQFISNLDAGTHAMGYGPDKKDKPKNDKPKDKENKDDVHQVPEPGVLSLLLAGAGILALRRRQKRQQ